MKTWRRLVFLAALLLLALQVNPARAEPPTSGSADAIEVNVAPALPGYVNLPAHMDLESSRQHPYFNRRGYCCDSYPGSPGCGNLHETCRFIFGSCRSFFGEPCPPKPQRHLLHGPRSRWAQ
jgi:hypothetical protein